MLLFALLGIWLHLGIASPTTPVSTLPSRAMIIAQALREHPAALVSRMNIEASQAEVAGASSYAPLMLDLAFAPGMIMMKPGITFEASWALPLWGKRRHAQDAAKMRVQVAQVAARMTSAELAANTSIALDTWWLAKQRLQMLDHHKAVLAQAHHTTAHNVSAATARPADVSMVSMASIEIDEQRIIAQQELQVAASAILALTGLGKDQLDENLLAPLDRPPPASDPEHVPTVDIAMAEVQIRDHMLQMAARENRPSITPMVSLNTMWEAPMDWAMVGVGVGIPVDTRAFKARRQAALERKLSAKASVDVAHRESERALAQARAAWQMGHDMQVLMSEHGIPLAQERARLARNAWESARGPLVTWLDAERDLVEIAWKISQAKVTQSSAIAIIAMIAGEPERLTAE